MRRRRWVEFLQDFFFEIMFRPKKENQAVNVLSHIVLTLAISLASLTLLEEVQQFISDDVFFGPLIQ